MKPIARASAATASESSSLDSWRGAPPPRGRTSGKHQMTERVVGAGPVVAGVDDDGVVLATELRPPPDLAREHVPYLPGRQRRDRIGRIDDDGDPVERDHVLARRGREVAEGGELLGLIGTDATRGHRHVARPRREVLEAGGGAVRKDLDRLDRAV